MFGWFKSAPVESDAARYLREAHADSQKIVDQARRDHAISAQKFRMEAEREFDRAFDPQTPVEVRSVYILERGKELHRLYNEADQAAWIDIQQVNRRHDEMMGHLKSIDAAINRPTAVDRMIDFAQRHPVIAGFVATEIYHRVKQK